MIKRSFGFFFFGGLMVSPAILGSEGLALMPTKELFLLGFPFMVQSIPPGEPGAGCQLVPTPGASRFGDRTSAGATRARREASCSSWPCPAHGRYLRGTRAALAANSASEIRHQRSRTASKRKGAIPDSFTSMQACKSVPSQGTEFRPCF